MMKENNERLTSYCTHLYVYKGKSIIQIEQISEKNIFLDIKNEHF